MLRLRLSSCLPPATLRQPPLQGPRAGRRRAPRDARPPVPPRRAKLPAGPPRRTRMEEDDATPEPQRQPLGHRAPPGRTLALTRPRGRCTARSRRPAPPSPHAGRLAPAPLPSASGSGSAPACCPTNLGMSSQPGVQSGEPQVLPLPSPGNPKSFRYPTRGGDGCDFDLESGISRKGRKPNTRGRRRRPAPRRPRRPGPPLRARGLPPRLQQIVSQHILY